ncbi:MAG: carbohydrate-binding family 9-like protein [Acidobacteria bacterium]|nr:carbohydrate-binding family 9-like protein [Acidobacteriota bacterium]
MKPKRTSISYIANEIDIRDIDNDVWRNFPETAVSTYWSGAEAPEGRHFSFKILWSAENLYVLFRANTGEPLIVAEKPDLARKSLGLWDRDVCEIFIAPNRDEPRRYFEFEAAPTGEWLDVALDLTGGERISDWEYNSGMKTASRIEDDHTITMIQIPFTSLGKTPKPGDLWLGNIFRCVGKDPTRGYLTWSPTMTETPNFHVPERFGEFVFK